jgi:hypothetical protein
MTIQYTVKFENGGVTITQSVDGVIGVGGGPGGNPRGVGGGPGGNPRGVGGGPGGNPGGVGGGPGGKPGGVGGGVGDSTNVTTVQNGGQVLAVIFGPLVIGSSAASDDAPKQPDTVIDKPTSKT